MATAYLLVAVLLTLTCEMAVAQDKLVHTLIWDRFWFAANFSNYTLNVRVGDSIRFMCLADNSEQPMDIFENVILLTDEKHLNNCDVGTGVSKNLGECRATGFDNTIPVTDAPPLANRPSFAAGESYYFTSFSDGTIISAENDKSQGGACARDPPLRLTVNVAGTSSSIVSSPMPTIATTTTTSIRIVPTSTLVPPSSSATRIVIFPTASPVVGDVRGSSRIGQSPLCYIMLLLLLLTSVLIL